MKIRKKFNLSDVDVREITLCKSPAVSDGTFLIMKSTSAMPKDTDEVSFHAEFLKFDDEQQIAYGYPLVPDIEDKQEDTITTEEIEKTAHRFMEILSKGEQLGTGTGYEHQVFEDVGHPVESAIDRDGSIAKSFGVPDEHIHPGGWWVGIKMADEYWKMAKSGDITGFSIGGSGKKTPVDKSDVSTEETTNLLIQGLLKLCGGEKKRKTLGKVTEYSEIAKAFTYDEITTTQAVLDAIIEKTWALYDAIWSGVDDPEVGSKVAWVQKNVEQFLADIKELEDIEKKLNKPNAEGDSAMEEQITKMSEALTKLTDTVKELEKKLDKPDSDSLDDNKPDDDVKKAEEEKVKELEKSIETLTGTVTSLSDTVKKMAKVPDERNGDEGSPDPEPAKVVKNEDGSISTAELRKGTALSFVRKDPFSAGDSATAPEKKKTDAA